MLYWTAQVIRIVEIMCCCVLCFSATEAHDHDGLPHTLEHLIFMGSEKYPYKVCMCSGNQPYCQVTPYYHNVEKNL